MVYSAPQFVTGDHFLLATPPLLRLEATNPLPINPLHTTPFKMFIFFIIIIFTLLLLVIAAGDDADNNDTSITFHCTTTETTTSTQTMLI